MRPESNPANTRLPLFIPAKRGHGWLYALGVLILLVAGACYYVVAILLPAQALATKPLPAVAAVDPVLPRLASVDTRLAGIDKALAELLTHLRDLQADVSSIKAKLDKPAPVASAEPAVGPSHRVAHRPKPVAVSTVPVDTTQLLSVDVWDNKPSIVLRGPDGRVRFAQDGETTAQGRYSVGRGDAQSVRVEHEDGSASVLQGVGDR
jgi:hypothetical protein